MVKLNYGFYHINIYKDNKLLVMKKIITFILCLLYFANVYSQDSTIIVRNFIERKLKDYAFCSCLYHSQTEETNNLKTLLSKDGSMSGYYNVLELNHSYFESIDSLAYNQSRIVYYSKYEKPLLFMKCLDFYNSKVLIDTVKSIVDRSYEEWSDPIWLNSLYNVAKLHNVDKMEQVMKYK